MTVMSMGTVTPIQRCLDGLRAGDPAARGELLRVSRERLAQMTRKLLHGFPGVHRWENTDDVLQNVLIRLDRALAEIPLESSRDFLRLAAAQIRRELIDLARHYFGPEGLGAKHATPQGSGSAGGPPEVPSPESGDGPVDWGELHEQAAALPDKQREVFDLLWYHGMSQKEAAALLNVSVRTVKTRWQAARMHLAKALGVAPPS